MSSQVLAKGLGGFGALTARSIDSGLRHFRIDELGFDEPTSFECVHTDEPLIAGTDELFDRN